MHEPAPDLAKLASYLDELAQIFHETPAGAPTDTSVLAVQPDYKELYSAIGARFPDLGLYATADPREVVMVKPEVGDAIDDLADIARDLCEVVWRWENNGPDDANCAFRFGYQAHWGRHLHDLRSYIHALQFESGGYDDVAG